MELGTDMPALLYGDTMLIKQCDRFLSSCTSLVTACTFRAQGHSDGNDVLLARAMEHYSFPPSSCFVSSCATLPNGDEMLLDKPSDESTAPPMSLGSPGSSLLEF